MGLPLMIAGVGLQAFGEYQQGQALYDQAKTEQEILNHNASIKDREAALELERARAQAQQFEEEGDRLLSSQNVAIAKGGVLSSSGTPLTLMEVTADTLDQDRRGILREGFINQAFRQSEAENLRYQGRAALSRGKNLRTASYINVGTTLLSGFTRIGQTLGSFGGSGQRSGGAGGQDLWEYRRQNPGSGWGGTASSGGGVGDGGGGGGGGGGG